MPHNAPEAWVVSVQTTPPCVLLHTYSNALTSNKCVVFVYSQLGLLKPINLYQSTKGESSTIVFAGTFPIDLTKTRLQVQGQTFNAHYTEIRYKGMFHALLRIVREEGCLALYSG